jgi:hypothetical protein
MISRKLLATVTMTAALAFGSAAMAQMSNDTMGGTNRSGMESGQPQMQSRSMDDRGMATGTTRAKSMTKARSKKMKHRTMRNSKRQMGNTMTNSASGMSKTNGGRGGNMGGGGMN